MTSQVRSFGLAGTKPWTLLCVALAACSSPVVTADPQPMGLDHSAGAAFAAVRIHHGIPILQKSFFWDGNGEVDNTGASVHVGRHVADGVALGVGATAASWWTPGHNVYSAEVEGLLRVHPLRELPFFLDGFSGYQLATDQIPPGGTVWNFSFGFGAGVEVPVGPGTSVLSGVTYHHISNALGRDNERNPSQNEARVWVGFAWSF